MYREFLITLQVNGDGDICKFYKYNENKFVMIKYVHIHGKEEEVYGSSLELVNNVINKIYQDHRVVELPTKFANFWKKKFKEKGIEYPQPFKKFDPHRSPENCSYQDYFGDNFDEFKEII